MEARGLPRPARGRDLFGARLVAARPRRGAGHLQGEARQCLLTDRPGGHHAPARPAPSLDGDQAAPRHWRKMEPPRHVSSETAMPLVSMRQLLDHAAEHGYGLPAFNVNNLEQVQAIMAAAAETDSPVIMQASAGARKYAGEHFLRHLIEAAVESYPERPGRHAPGPRPVAGDLRVGDQARLLQRDDGRLAARPTARPSPSYDYNVDVTRKVVDDGARDRRHRRGRAGLPRLARDDEGRQGGRPRRRRHDDARDAAHRSRPGRRLRQEHAARRAGHRHRHLARRLQVLAQAHRRHPRDRPHQGDPRAHPEHAPGDARLVLACRRTCCRSSARTAAR